MIELFKISRLFFCSALCIMIAIAPACKNETKPAEENSSMSDEKKEENIIVITPTVAGQVDTVKTSLKAVADGKLRGANLKLSYSSPAVRGRKIWGGLVPYDKIWVTGAHMATTLESDKQFSINNTKFPAGKFAFFTIPDEENWTVIINKNWDQHQADKYNSDDDLLRMNVKPEALTTHQERLMYEFDQTGEGKVSLRMKWEKLGISVPIVIE